MYSDAQAAALYDVINPWAADTDHYAVLARAVPTVLDVGCGTGTLLSGLRDAGHAGRLVGVDPDLAALERARRRTDVEWVQDSAASMSWHAEFALAVMTGHAFQCLITDEDVASSLTAIHRALIPGGRFAFETRNPVARSWERWAAQAEPSTVLDPDGRHLLVRLTVPAVEGDVVTIEEATCESDGRVLRTDTARLRFLGVDQLDAALAQAGFAVEHRYGGWHGEPFTATSTEIVTTAMAS